MFTDLAYSDGYDVLCPSGRLAEFSRGVVSRRNELPRMWEELVSSLRKYYAYISETGSQSLKLIEELYSNLFDSSKGRRRIYEDYRVKRMKLNEDPEDLFRKYYEYFPNPEEVDLQDLAEEVLRTHYAASLSAHSIIRRKEHLKRGQIHPFVVKTLCQSYIEFWVTPDRYYQPEDYFIEDCRSRKRRPSLPWLRRELEDFSDDRPYYSDPHPEDWE